MKLCVSLDLPSAVENLALVEQIKDFDVWLKVGLRSYTRDGKNFLEDLKAINPSFKLFLDLKLYDIPNTMADAAQEIAQFGLVDMFNVHASSGKRAMQTVMQRIENIPNKPLVLAVTALTSFDNDEFKAVYNEDIKTKATKLAIDTFESGVDGVVCSAFESLDIKNSTSNEFITLCPGIRPFGEDSGDQKRVADIPFSKENQVDFIVVGRPIYKAQNPKEVVKKILDNI
ncbi:orotidine-5'-phosphate decarboxylase [Halarcobacter ebronensis]|uniref:Orotidine 5'-phosphate decarboxylase n=1 Tax=Halarcobacter ebronensis TaxID=1462615 RepID=A0A4Q1AF15_9BACT|nr:orotidine-5'-phosphate decarboxylase [Halarcobacter ebronensis]QKF82645.1 orotidine-5'-phosphate decarboxylase [Halarcobacter ebronensis]RXK02068.1 orotidine-5'-phosphate decarboxylase [Halarcobacter ebronensis]